MNIGIQLKYIMNYLLYVLKKISMSIILIQQRIGTIHVSIFLVKLHRCAVSNATFMNSTILQGDNLKFAVLIPIFAVKDGGFVFFHVMISTQSLFVLHIRFSL